MAGLAIRVDFPNVWLCRLYVNPVTYSDAVATVVKPTLTALYDRFVTFSRRFDKYHFFLGARRYVIGT